MFWMLMMVIALCMPLTQAADDPDRDCIDFLHALCIYISGPSSGRTIEVKSSESKVVGRIEYEIYGNAAVCEPTGSIECLEVDVQFRRHGIGTLLFQTALDDMRNQGCKNVSWQSTQEAVPFYTKQGAVYMYAEQSSDAQEPHHGMRIQTTAELALSASHLRKIIDGE